MKRVESLELPPPTPHNNGSYSRKVVLHLLMIITMCYMPRLYNHLHMFQQHTPRSYLTNSPQRKCVGLSARYVSLTFLYSTYFIRTGFYIGNLICRCKSALHCHTILFCLIFWEFFENLLIGCSNSNLRGFKIKSNLF